MQERQVTIGDATYPLPEPFLVLATQNPIEQEGTYPLPEAQVDRFLLKVKVDYPTRDEERQILDRMRLGRRRRPWRTVLSGDARAPPAPTRVREVYMDERVRDYIVDLVRGHARARARSGLADLAPPHRLRRLAPRHPLLLARPRARWPSCAAAAT